LSREDEDGLTVTTSEKGEDDWLTAVAAEEEDDAREDGFHRCRPHDLGPRV
jgi:hypothetical protein